MRSWVVRALGMERSRWIERRLEESHHQPGDRCLQRTPTGEGSSSSPKSKEPAHQPGGRAGAQRARCEFQALSPRAPRSALCPHPTKRINSSHQDRCTRQRTRLLSAHNTLKTQQGRAAFKHVWRRTSYCFPDLEKKPCARVFCEKSSAVPLKLIALFSVLPENTDSVKRSY